MALPGMLGAVPSEDHAWVADAATKAALVLVVDPVPGVS
jgi:hypothetical protein